jgi:hypothetical protein
MANSMIPIINPGRVDARHLSMNVPSNLLLQRRRCVPVVIEELALARGENRTPIRN